MGGGAVASTAGQQQIGLCSDSVVWSTILAWMDAPRPRAGRREGAASVECQQCKAGWCTGSVQAEEAQGHGRAGLARTRGGVGAIEGRPLSDFIGWGRPACTTGRMVEGRGVERQGNGHGQLVGTTARGTGRDGPVRRGGTRCKGQVG